MRLVAHLHTRRRQRETGELLAIPVQGRGRLQAACFLTSLCLHGIAVSFLILINALSVRRLPDPSWDFRVLIADHGARLTWLDLQSKETARHTLPQFPRKALVRRPRKRFQPADKAEPRPSPTPKPPLDTLKDSGPSTKTEQPRARQRFEMASRSAPRPQPQPIAPQPAPLIELSPPPDLPQLQEAPTLRIQALAVELRAPPKPSLPTDLTSPTLSNAAAGLPEKFDWVQPIEPLRYFPAPSQAAPPRAARIAAAPAPHIQAAYAPAPALDFEAIHPLPRLRYFSPPTAAAGPGGGVVAQALVPSHDPASLEPAAGKGVPGSTFAGGAESAAVLSLVQPALPIGRATSAAGGAAGTLTATKPNENAIDGPVGAGSDVGSTPSLGFVGEPGTEAGHIGVGESSGATASTGSAGGGGPPGFAALSGAAAGAVLIATRPEPRRNPVDGLEYAWIPPGTFHMGCVPEDAECRDIEKPQHAVRLDRGYWMGRTEVTVRAYGKFAKDSGASMPEALAFNAGWKKKDHPMVRVSWAQAARFCEWSGGRLPTEAEWEHAARGGKEGLRFPWGGNADPNEANYRGTGGRDRWEQSAPVGSFSANPYGLFDMAGNAWEWVADWRGPSYYAESAAADPEGPPTGDYRVIRGGSFYSDSESLRVSHRGAGDPEAGLFYHGFRCARDQLP